LKNTTNTKKNNNSNCLTQIPIFLEDKSNLVMTKIDQFFAKNRKKTEKNRKNRKNTKKHQKKYQSHSSSIPSYTKLPLILHRFNNTFIFHRVSPKPYCKHPPDDGVDQKQILIFRYVGFYSKLVQFCIHFYYFWVAIFFLLLFLFSF
jgi:hypothetical protein